LTTLWLPEEVVAAQILRAVVVQEDLELARD
jgi:hypothetical protein